MKKTIVFLFVILAVLLSGCYINEEVKPSEVGVTLDGGRIEGCVTPGVHTDTGFFADLVKVSSATVTFSVEDPEVATSDTQLVGVKITIQARRLTDCDSATNLLTNWPALLNDEGLVSVVSATTREAIKNGVRAFTLDELLNDRNGLANSIAASLELDSVNYSVDIVNVTVENVALSADYATVLQEKALLTAQIETELRRQDLIRQTAENQIFEQEQREMVLNAQLLAEQAQTSVQVEIASRAGEVIAAQNAVYMENERAYELERLRLMSAIFGDKVVYYFVPQGADLTLLLNQQTEQIVPVPVEGAPSP